MCKVFKLPFFVRHDFLSTNNFSSKNDNFFQMAVPLKFDCMYHFRYLL